MAKVIIYGFGDALPMNEGDCVIGMREAVVHSTKNGVEVHRYEWLSPLNEQQVCKAVERMEAANG